MKHYIRNGFILALAGLCFAALPARAATQVEINTSVEKGLAWLAARQNGNGSFPGSGYGVGDTGLAVTVFIHYAKHLEQDPFSPAFIYSAQVINGLNYIFANTSRDAGNQRVSWGNSNYMWGPAVMAITASGQKNRVVDVAGSPVNGLTYLQIVQEALRWIEYSQITAGAGIGFWDYNYGGTGGDISAAGWVTLGMGYASHNFDMILSPTLLSQVSVAISNNQWTGDTSDPRYGGAWYRSDYHDWINLYKAGHLLYMMELVGDTAAAPRVQRVLDYIIRHWNNQNNGYNSSYPILINGTPDMGWRGGAVSPLPSYIATATMMKAFLAWGFDSIGAGINWYEEMTDVIVARQDAAGWWDQGGYPPYYRELSTVWALLTMLRAAPASGSITDITTTTAKFNAETPDNGTGYFVVVPRNAPAPIAGQIKAGTDGVGTPGVCTGSGAMIGETVRVFPLTGLQPGTRYDLYFVNETSPAEFSPVLRVQFLTLSQGSVIDVTSVVNMDIINWALNYSTGAMIATVRLQYRADATLKAELHSTFWFAMADSADGRLEKKDGTTSGGMPYTDVTKKVEASLQSSYGRIVMRPGDVALFTVGIWSRNRVPAMPSLHAIWADPPIHAADVNRDGVIDDFEILTVVDEWCAGRMNDFDFLGAVELWRNGAQP